jgi:DNA-binding transcriptional LysR family regulator
MDRLAAMAVFVQVVERKSFSAAARQLGITVSTVSKHVARLEDWLGAKLVNRTTRRLALTEVGAAFYQRCVRVTSEVEEAEAAASTLHGTPQGTLRVNAPLSFGVMHIVPAMPAFLAQHPRVKVDLAFTDRAVDPIEGGFDVTVRIALLPDSSLIARKLAPNRMVVCGAPSYFALHGVPQVPQDLAEHSCLSYTHVASPWTWRFGRRGETLVRVSGGFQANSGDALRDAAIAGLGIVQLPSFIVGPAVEAGTLRAVLEDTQSPEYAIWALFAPGRVPVKVRTFVDFLTRRYGPRPYWEPKTNRRR